MAERHPVFRLRCLHCTSLVDIHVKIDDSETIINDEMSSRVLNMVPDPHNCANGRVRYWRISFG
jgi:hypothetical protein